MFMGFAGTVCLIVSAFYPAAVGGLGLRYSLCLVVAISIGTPFLADFVRWQSRDMTVVVLSLVGSRMCVLWCCFCGRTRGHTELTSLSVPYYFGIRITRICVCSVS